MNYKVTKRLEELYRETAYIDLEKGTVDFNAACLIAAGECERIAVEFAKSLMDSEVSTQRSGKVGETSKEVTKYNPPEYNLMKGELIMNGDNLFNNFIDNYYEKTKS